MSNSGPACRMLVNCLSFNEIHKKALLVDSLTKKCEQQARELQELRSKLENREKSENSEKSEKNEQSGSGVTFPIVNRDPDGPISTPSTIEKPKSKNVDHRNQSKALDNINIKMVLSSVQKRYKTRASTLLEKLSLVGSRDIKFNDQGEVFIDGVLFPNTSINKLMSAALYGKKNVRGKTEWIKKLRELDLLSAQQKSQHFEGDWFYIGDAI